MEETNPNEEQENISPKVYGWVAGTPAYLQEHPNNKTSIEENK